MRAFVLSITACLVMPAVAEETEVDLASGELVENNLARIVTHVGKPADCLAPIAVNKIDGKHRYVPARGFLLEPGVHTLNARAVLDTTYCTVDPRARGGSTPDLEVAFEAGKTYYIGYHHQPEDTSKWKLVVWKVE